MFNGSLRSAGSGSSYWTSTVGSPGSFAYSFNLDGAVVYPSSNNYRWNGFTVRGV